MLADLGLGSILLSFFVSSTKSSEIGRDQASRVEDCSFDIAKKFLKMDLFKSCCILIFFIDHVGVSFSKSIDFHQEGRNIQSPNQRSMFRNLLLTDLNNHSI